ncbi:hypothetical protein MSHRCOH1_05880 [Candidatus Ornithobacterium hominis]|uniref:hypothetical protein n=1 Tax=Candidatus Ornithobacterium hominis TaxID=2497989 RepID=UPI0024BD184A|nr:hypothetical protein [Candidatus Ornithobacterium hominis]CAI9429722.1 hypothetical protein MSHRCOH1_05880 [Candidatus Ornithobacterium hominis]
MNFKIEKLHSDAYKVNGKAVLRNELGDWLAPFHTLSDAEWNAFYEQLILPQPLQRRGVKITLPKEGSSNLWEG